MTGRFAALALAHRLPKHRVVGMPATVVANGSTNSLWHFFQIGNELVYGQIAEGIALQSLVDVRDIGSVVFVVVDLHRASIDERLQSVEGVGQSGQRVGHEISSPGF